jgi:hypothetical protein
LTIDINNDELKQRTTQKERTSSLCPLKGINKIIEFSLDELSGRKQNIKK